MPESNNYKGIINKVIVILLIIPITVIQADCPAGIDLHGKESSKPGTFFN
jgi:hypothetical protein